MILVTLGTQKQPFTRILDIIEKSSIDEEIIVQAGHTKYQSKKMKIFNFINYEEMNDLVEKADVIITHGGTGSIVGPLKKGKKIIAIARLKKNGEHVDDHQNQIVEMFAEVGYILKYAEGDDIEKLVKEIKQKEMLKFNSNSEKFIQKIEQEIETEIPKMNIANKLYLIMLIFILSFGLIALIRKPRDISSVENRKLAYLKNVTIERYMSGEFQSNLESTLSDQFIGGETIKLLMNKYFSLINAQNAMSKYCQNDYISMGKGYEIFDCSDYMVNFPSSADLANNSYFNYRVSELNKINKNFDVYYYIINKSVNINFKTNKKTLDLYSQLKNKLINIAGISELEINNYEQYKKYYYKTDHHWNYNGSYQGYKDIMKMFNVNNIIKPIEELTFQKTIFYGSSARKIPYYNIKEPFTAYKFLFEEHDEYIDGTKSIYGKYKDFYNNDFDNSSITNFYAYYYGSDQAEIKYDFHNQERDDILIISSTYSNPINTLIASHFNKTYVVDLCHYENFNIYEYMNKNKLKKILIIADINFYNDSDFELGV